MPKVPVYEGNQVQSQAAPSVGITAQTSVENFGGGAANALTALERPAARFVDAYNENKRKADQLAVYEASAKLSEVENSLLYDPQNGALNKRGKDSFSLPAAVQDSYVKMSNDVSNSLTNDEQKAAFRRIQMERGVQVDRSVQKHVSGEILRYDNDVTTNFIKNEQDAAIKSYKDPVRVMMSIENQKQAIKDFGSRNGLSTEEIAQKESQLVSSTHKEIINRMLTNDEDMSAQEYYQVIKEEVKGTDLADVEKAIEAGSLRGNSQRFVDGLLKEGLSETQALARARTIKDPKLRDATVERTRNEFNIKEAAERQELEDKHVNALNVIDKRGVKVVADLQKLPGWNDMTVGQRNSLESYMESKILGKDTTTDPQTYYNLKTMASVPATKDAFVKMNLMEKRTSLSASDFKQMVDLQSQLRQGKGEAEKVLNGWRSDDQVVKDVAESAGINPKNKNFNEFSYRVEQAQIAEQERLGRKLNNIELADLTKRLTMPIVTKERWYWSDDEKKIFEATDEELQNIKYKDVPSTEKVKIENSLRKMNRPVSEEAVRSLYVNKLLKDRNGAK